MTIGPMYFYGGFGKKKATEKGNLLRPCPYRDHHKQFMEWTKKFDLEPEDLSAKELLLKKDIHEKMIKYDKELADLFDPIWNRDYLKK